MLFLTSAALALLSFQLFILRLNCKPSLHHRPWSDSSFRRRGWPGPAGLRDRTWPPPSISPPLWALCPSLSQPSLLSLAGPHGPSGSPAVPPPLRPAGPVARAALPPPGFLGPSARRQAAERLQKRAKSSLRLGWRGNSARGWAARRLLRKTWCQGPRRGDEEGRKHTSSRSQNRPARNARATPGGPQANASVAASPL